MRVLDTFTEQERCVRENFGQPGGPACHPKPFEDVGNPNRTGQGDLHDTALRDCGKLAWPALRIRRAAGVQARQVPQVQVCRQVYLPA